MEPASTTPPQAVPGFVTADLLLAAIVDSSDDAIISKSVDSIVTSWNQGAERIFGYKEEEMIGRSITAIIPPDRLDEEPQIVTRLKRGERVDHFDSVRIRKDGSLVSVSLTISPIRNEEGVIVGASKIARDITERKRAEELLLARKAELQRATDEAREAVAEAARQSRMKDEFLATLSHELRTPLQSILGWTQLLMAGECSEAELKQGLEVIDRNSRSQVRIIEDLLDMSSILSGKVKLDMQRVELKAVIAAAVETVTPAAQAKGIRLETAYHHHAAQHVIGDGGRLQ